MPILAMALVLTMTPRKREPLGAKVTISRLKLGRSANGSTERCLSQPRSLGLRQRLLRVVMAIRMRR